MACRFFLHYRLPSGLTPVEEFAGDAPGLTDEERAALRGWTQDIVSLFEILRIEGRRLDLREVITGKEFPVRPNIAGPLDAFQSGWFVRTRLVPVRDFYSFSGAQHRHAPDERRSLIRKLEASGVAVHTEISTRWKPTADHPAPPPTAPCPCGSGRRFKKCCMKR